MTALGWVVLTAINAIVLAYFVLLNGVYLLTSIVAFRYLRRYALRLKSIDVEDLMALDAFPPVTIVAPAYNEEDVCVAAVKSLLTLQYPDYQVLLVNDGSKDATLERLVEAFELEACTLGPTSKIPTADVKATYRSSRHPNLWVIDKENGGKADAANVGINHCRTPLFCVIDADGILEPDALIRVARIFIEDTETVAVGGIIRIVNGCTVEGGLIRKVELPRNLWARIQVMEYLRAFLSGRVGWADLNATLIISGAFGAFRRETVVAAGGLNPNAIGEDMELVTRLHRYCADEGIPCKVAFVPDPVAWTECPERLKDLGNQRERWQRGLMQTLWWHRPMLFNPRHGAVGTLGFPYFFFLEMLGPVIEGAGYISFAITVILGGASGPYIVAFLMLALVLGFALSVAAIGLEELTFRRYTRSMDVARLFWVAFIENFGYRQLSTWWRIRGFVNGLRGKTTWGEMKRSGSWVSS